MPSTSLLCQARPTSDVQKLQLEYILLHFSQRHLEPKTARRRCLKLGHSSSSSVSTVDLHRPSAFHSPSEAVGLLHGRELCHFPLLQVLVQVVSHLTQVI